MTRWISGLCSAFHPKSSSSSLNKSQTSSNDSFDETKTEKHASQTQDQRESFRESNINGSPPTEEEAITELESAIHGPIYGTANLPAGSTSKRRLSVSSSIKTVKDGFSRIKTKKEKINVIKSGGGEESLWKKTIILGEKCKMQDEEDGGEETSTRNISMHARTPRSSQMSRNTSFANSEVEH